MRAWTCTSWYLCFSSAIIAIAFIHPLLSSPTTGPARSLRSRSRSSSSRASSGTLTSSTRSRTAIRMRMRTLRATPSSKLRKGTGCLCGGWSASTAHSGCSGSGFSGSSSLQFARSRIGPAGAGASRFGRKPIAPTVTSGSNWPCSRTWSRASPTHRAPTLPSPLALAPSIRARRTAFARPTFRRITATARRAPSRRLRSPSDVH